MNICLSELLNQSFWHLQRTLKNGMLTTCRSSTCTYLVAINDFMSPLIVSGEYVNHRVSMDLNMLYSEIAYRRRCSVLAQMFNLMFYCSIAQAYHNFSIIFNREFAIANKVVLPIHGKHKLRLLDEFTSKRHCFCRLILDSLDAPVQIKGQCRELHCMAHLSTSM